MSQDQESPHILPLKKINGVIVPPFFSQKVLEKDMKCVSLRSDDIWVVTYPKAGTTWVQQIVRLIRNGGKGGDENIDEAIPWLESLHEIPDIDKLLSPRAFKSHFSYELMSCGLPNSTPGRYIYVARNPKDLAVSCHFHMQRIPFAAKYEWDEFFEHFMNGNLEFGGYFDHVLSWWAHRDDDNVLFLKYEDLKKDLPLAVKTIGEFIGYDLSQEIITHIADKTSFKVMKDDKTANKSWYNVPNETPFMRKGEIGDWKNYFTPDQSARLDSIYEERMKISQLKFYFGPE